MIKEYDEAYYLRRETAARRLARLARDHYTVAIHNELADRYGRQARDAAERQRVTPISPAKLT